MPIDQNGKYEDYFDYNKRIRAEADAKAKSFRSKAANAHRDDSNHHGCCPNLTPDPDVSPFIKAAYSSTE